jgi:hypothetical protein
MLSADYRAKARPLVPAEGLPVPPDSFLYPPAAHLHLTGTLTVDSKSCTICTSRGILKRSMKPDANHPNDLWGLCSSFKE